MDRVSVKVKKENRTVQLSRNVAESWVKRQPDDYEIVAPPRIEVTKLDPIKVEQVEKKSAEVAPNVPKVEVKREADKVLKVQQELDNISKQASSQLDKPKKQGRPKKSV